MATHMSIRRTRVNNLQYQHTMVKTSVVNACAWTWDHFSNYFTIVEWIKQTRVFCKQLWNPLCRNRIFFQNGIHLSIYIHIQIQRKRCGKRHIQSLMAVTTGKRCGFRVEVGNGEQLSHFIHHTYSLLLFFFLTVGIGLCTVHLLFKIGLEQGNGAVSKSVSFWKCSMLSINVSQQGLFIVHVLKVHLVFHPSFFSDVCNCAWNKEAARALLSQTQELLCTHMRRAAGSGQLDPIECWSFSDTKEEPQ